MQDDLWSSTTQGIRRLMSPCPVCGKTELTGHGYFLLASQVAENQTDELKAFFDLYKQRRWEELSKIREFKGTADAVLVYVMLCSSRGCAFAVRDPFELYGSDELLDLTPIGEQEVGQLRSLQVELHEL